VTTYSVPVAAPVDTGRPVRWSPRDSVVILLYFALSLGLYWPLLTRLSSAIPGDPGDPLLNTLILWWNAQHLPWSAGYWDAPFFAPAPNILALSETLLGLTWLTTPLQWLGAAPLVAYNVMFLLTPVMNGATSYALCRHLTGRRDAALVGSIYFTLAPYRAEQVSHLQTEAAFFMPLGLLALHRFWESSRRRWLVALALCTFLNGCISGYHLLYFAIPLGLVLAWLSVSAPDWKKATAVGLAIAAALAAMAPVLVVYARVHAAWGLKRGLEEMAIFSADVASFMSGASTLLLWRVPHLVSKPEGAVYPGVVMLALLGIGWLEAALHPVRAAASIRPPRSLALLRSVLLAVSAVGCLAAAATWLAGPLAFHLGPLPISISQMHKPLGLALNALFVFAATSPDLWQRARAGSLPGLYLTLFLLATILMLGPDGEFFGHRVWYKAPFAWLVELPGFNSVRVPARMAVIQILAASILCAFVVTRLAPRPGRRGTLLAAGLSAVLAADGWFSVNIVAAPPPPPVALGADLVLELPTRGWAEDVAAMYRGMAHGRPVVNGYSGYPAPHYELLLRDLRAGCFESMEALRRGRSLDIVIWRADPDAGRILDALTSQWPAAPREGADRAIVVRVPSAQDRAGTAHDDPIDIGSYCQASRAASAPTL
jgi:hypothetical protein